MLENALFQRPILPHEANAIIETFAENDITMDMFWDPEESGTDNWYLTFSGFDSYRNFANLALNTEWFGEIKGEVVPFGDEDTGIEFAVNVFLDLPEWDDWREMFQCILGQIA